MDISIRRLEAIIILSDKVKLETFLRHSLATYHGAAVAKARIDSILQCTCLSFETSLKNSESNDPPHRESISNVIKTIKDLMLSAGKMNRADFFVGIF